MHVAASLSFQDQALAKSSGFALPPRPPRPKASNVPRAFQAKGAAEAGRVSPVAEEAATPCEELSYGPAVIEARCVLPPWQESSET